MFKKILCFLSALVLVFFLTACSTESTFSPEPTREPSMIYHVGERIQIDLVSFMIRKGMRFDATVDKAHTVYGIQIYIANYDSYGKDFRVSDVVCYAGGVPCEIYTGFEGSLTDTIIPANGKLEGWIYYKIPLQHDGLSFGFSYDYDYVLFIFEEG